MRWILGGCDRGHGKRGVGGECGVKRGSYLVNTIMTCGNCHTPKGPTGDVKEKALGFPRIDEPPFSHKKYHAGRPASVNTAKQLKNVLLTGIKPTGTPLAEIMPTSFYQILTAKATPTPSCLSADAQTDQQPSAKSGLQDGAAAPSFPGFAYTQSQLRNKVKRGFICHHRALHGMPYADGAERPTRQRSRQGRIEFKARGAYRCRAILHQARPRGSASGPTPRSRLRSRTACDGSKLKPPMAATTRV